MLQPDEIKLLRANFPPESLQMYKKYRDPETGEDKILVGYKPQYIIERLNDCFGHEGWDFEILEMGVADSSAWCRGRLTVYLPKYDADGINGPLQRCVVCRKDQVGAMRYSKGTLYGDALKGAATNALEKCAAMLDIGNSAYKGLEKMPVKDADPIANTDLTEIEKLKTELKVVCKDNKIGKEAFKVLVKNVLKEDKESSSLDEEELQKLIDYVKTNKAPF